jgi:hypothetical protein
VKVSDNPFYGVFRKSNQRNHRFSTSPLLLHPFALPHIT